MLNEAQVAEIKARAELEAFAASWEREDLVPDIDALLADRDELVRRLAKVRELADEVLRLSGACPLACDSRLPQKHHAPDCPAAPMEDT